MRWGAGAIASHSSPVIPAAVIPPNHGRTRRSGGWRRKLPIRAGSEPPAGSVNGVSSEGRAMAAGGMVAGGPAPVPAGTRSAIYQTPIRMMSW